jgi:transposase
MLVPEKGVSQVITFFEAVSPCLIGLEARATAHHWARELTKLGHEVRLTHTRSDRGHKL